MEVLIHILDVLLPAVWWQVFGVTDSLPFETLSITVRPP